MKSEVDKILYSVLSIYQPELYPEPQIVYVPVPYPKPDTGTGIPKGYNPDTHVIVLKEQLDIINGLKQLTGLVNKVESISEGVDYIKSRYTKSTAEDLKKGDVKSDKVEGIMAKLINKKR